MRAIRWIWICLTILAISAFGCDSEDDPNGSPDVQDTNAADAIDAVDGADGADGDSLDDMAVQFVTPHRETRDHFTIVWLSGTPYEMGYQHGELLHDELAAAVEYVTEDPLLSLMESVARLIGVLDLAYSNSYPDIVEECRGLTDAAGDTGFTMDLCMTLSFGDILVEWTDHGIPAQPGCLGIAATGGATPDGRLYHARNMDWDEIELLLDYPVIFVRQPSDGIAHAVIGFPGNLTPYQGLNSAGISVQSNEAHPLDNRFHDRQGHSHTQMMGQILKRAHSLEEATELILNEDHMSVEAIMVADGNTQTAAVFEMTSQRVGVRELSDDGILYFVNHFVAPETVDTDLDPVSDNNLLRYERLSQLLEPEGEGSLYGRLDPAGLIKVMRDRLNPWTGEESPDDIFSDDLSLATTGSLYQVVFDPQRLLFWVAAGEVPVPRQPFIGFSLSQLLHWPDVQPAVPLEFP